MSGLDDVEGAGGEEVGAVEANEKRATAMTAAELIKEPITGNDGRIEENVIWLKIKCDDDAAGYHRGMEHSYTYQTPK